jgi:hypothetical protein
LAHELNLTFVPSLTYESSLTFVPPYVPIMVSSSSDDDSEDENPPFLTHLHPDESIEHEPAPTPLLPRWVCSTREAVGDLFGDPSSQHHTCS